MKTLIFQLVSYTILINFSYGQNPSLNAQDAYQNLQEITMPGSQNVVRLKDERYEGVKGSTMIFDDWKLCNLYSSGISYKATPLNYNAFDNEVYIKYELGIVSVDLFKLDSFIVVENGSNVVFINSFSIQDHLNLEEHFFLKKILKTDETLLYEKYKVKFLKADYQGTFNAGRTYDEFYVIKETYLANNTKNIKVTSLKSIAEFYGKSKKELKNLTNNTDLDCSNGEELKLFILELENRTAYIKKF